MPEIGVIKGIGVLRYPASKIINGKSAREISSSIAENIKLGGIICLPNTRDSNGDYDWDFRVEPVTEEQIEIRRSDCDIPTIIEGNR